EINNQFILKHDRLVRVIVNQYQTKGIDKQDLVQEGYLGLMEAAKQYDPCTGVQFTSYASWWIRKYVSRSIAQFINILPVPARTGDQYTLKKRSFDDVFAVEDGDVITFAEAITDGICIEQTIIEQEETAELHERLQKTISHLTQREQQIVEGLYGLKNQPLTTEELAKKMGTSPNRIRRVHERAIHKVRHLMN
ncbi:MAG: sigma-70 family RNA polymerase sigma factor, partial [Candidatus Saccharibacteria bacterium]|nr:sigma-70 family RNA polymerase sigma factor [Candidatus Saccharibacteria bacterium]